MTFDDDHDAEYEFEVRRPGIAFEYERELGAAEDREIRRRVAWARKHRERERELMSKQLDKLRAGMKKRDPQGGDDE